MSSGKNFWDKEYKSSEHFSLSDRPAEDLLKFTRWLERESGKQFLNPTINVLDLGCGNGRNLIYLSQMFGCHGVGYDISDVAIKQAKITSELPIGPAIKAKKGERENGSKFLKFEARSIVGKFDLADTSFDIVLDMMTSHYLPEKERLELIKEIARVIKPGGWLFYKTFLLDEDLNAKRMIHDYPSSEPNSYIHPSIGSLEHVSTEDEIRVLYEPYFEIKKIEKTGKHILRGKAGKRRSIIAYLERKY